MATRTIDMAAAVQEHRNGSKETKAALERLLGAGYFQPVTDRIRSFEDACANQDLDPNQVLPYKGDNLTDDQRAINAYAQLLIIARSLQEGWEADYTNADQRKWWVWFEFKAGVGFVVDVTGYVNTFTHTAVGSRLCLPTQELARYFGAQFIELHRQVLTKNYSPSK